MARRSSLMSKVMVFLLAFAVVFTYSVMPMNQAYAASAKKPAKVKISSAKALSTSSFKVTWKKAKNAKKYEVYVSTKSKSGFKKVVTLKSSKRTYTVKKYNKKALKAGTKYYVKVRAVNGKKKGAFSAVKSVTTKKKATPTPEPEPKEIDPVLGAAKVRTLTVNIDMSKYDAGKTVKVWVPVPQSDQFQTITDVTFDGSKADRAELTTEKENGNEMLYLEWNASAEPANRKASLSFTAKRYDVSKEPVEDTTAGIPADVKPFITEESEYVKVNDPVVKETAQSIVEGKNGTLEKARAIYEWTIANLARIDNGEKIGDYVFEVDGCGYGDTVKILSDLKTYGIAGGHCTDINSTFVALCRAAGIPAREMFGIRLGDAGQDITTFQHCWAEFYLPGSGWVYADPADVLKAIKPEGTGSGKEIDPELWKAAKESDKAKERTEFFWAHVDNNRVVLSRGRDITFEPAQAWGVCNTFGYPAAEVDGKRLETSFTDAKNFVYTIKSEADRTVFVDADYVKDAVDKKAEGTVIAEVSWGADAPDYLIEGAIHVNTDDLESNYQDREYEFWDLRGFDDNYKELIEALGKYGITKDTELICYSSRANGAEATRLAMAALMMGVENVKVLDGGVPAYGDKGFPMTQTPAEPKAADFGRTEPLHPEWVISTADMLEKVKNDSNFKLVSIRSYDEYIGATSGYAYIDIAGEPEGAVWGRNTDEGTYFIDGKTVDTDKIDEYLEPYGASTKNELAFYCGTGWRATIPFIVCYEEGIDDMKLWDDGWYVYSGAYSDPWNYGDGTYKGGIEFRDYPVQIGDPAKGNVETTTVGALWDADTYRNPLRGLSAKTETFKAGVARTYPSNFDVKPPKGGILKSVKFTSSDETVATVDSEGKVTVLDATPGKEVTITAEAYATSGSTPDKAGEPTKKASYTLVTVEPKFVEMSAEEWAAYGITADELKDSDFLIDVRGAATFANGHLKGSVSCPVGNPYEENQKAAIAALYEENKDKERIVIVCVSGNMLAKNAMDALKASGADLSKVTYLIGGANGVKDDWVVDYTDYVSMSAEEWAAVGINAGEITNNDFLIDVRPDVQRTNNGFVPGAEICPVGNPYTAEQRKAVKEAADKADGKRVVIVCVTGNMLAKNAMTALSEAGYDMNNVTYLIGGFNGTEAAPGWKQTYPVVAPDKNSVSIPAWVTTGNGTDGKLAMIKKDDGTYAEDLTHHVLVNENGSNAPVALLNTKALPLQAYNALADIGGVPYDNFNKAQCIVDGVNQNVFLPDEAQKVNVSFKWDGGEATMSDFFKHVKTATADVKAGAEIELEDYAVDMRFGGCIENIKQNFNNASGNQTGCITCTFSCWIGQVSNAAYAYSTQEAFVNRDNVPAAGTPVTVIYTLGN